MTITQNIQVSKARVMDEVAKATAYIGQKAASQQDPGAYERIATTDANREELDRYWMEACTGASLLLDHWLTGQTRQTLTHHPDISAERDYNVTLGLPANWNFAYLNSVKEALLSYLVNSIVSQWLLRTQKQDAAAYAALANGAGRRIDQLMLLRVRPKRRATPGADDGRWHRADIWHRAELW